jgi:hypothetical protein
MRVTFGVSAVLATAGTALAVSGIHWGEFKPFMIGLVLLLGAGVFAILSLGARRTGVPPAEPPPEP